MWTGGIFMTGRNPIFYNAIVLTAVNLILRMVGTSFQVYISRRMGAAGIGLLQLTMSVGSLALVAGMAGIRTATMYLTADALGRMRPGQVTWILSGCIRYSLCISSSLAAILYGFAPFIAQVWIRDVQVVDALRLLALFLPVTCLCGVMTGYFTAACRIRTLAMVEIAEQMLSMGVTMGALTLWAKDNPGLACQSVILGSGAGSFLTAISLMTLRMLERSSCIEKIAVCEKILDTAVPLGAADVLKSGINTVENLMVPQRLQRNTAIANSLAAFGMVSGMVFPILLFPACILYSLAELLIPELSRCSAGGSRIRISYLARKSLGIALLYGCFFCGGVFLLAEPLCRTLYGNTDAAFQLKLYSLLIPMLYCDTITDAMTKGLGQQKICVRYNILTSALDVLFLYFLLPVWGMTGYYVSFLITHLLNFYLSLNLLIRITGQQLQFHIAALSLSALTLAIMAGSCFGPPLLRIGIYTAVLLSLWTLFGVIGKRDVRWIRQLLIS